MVEGRRRSGRAILPVAVNGGVHRLTQIQNYQNAGFLRTDYNDTEDYGQMHITFDDGTIADILASDVVLGGVSNWIEVFANNHRTRCMLNPVDALETFSPGEQVLRDVYIAEKLSPKLGWMYPAPDEDWMHGYPQEIQAFAEAIASGKRPESNGFLGEVCTAVLYAAYLSADRRGAAVEVPHVEEASY
jgi:predicted dehydrogenase